MQLIQRRITIFSNTKLREIFEFSASTPSKLKVQVFVLLFLVTLYFAVYTLLPLWELHPSLFISP